jgi:hypothetical protein
VDRCPRLRELASHGHEETIEDVQGILVCDFDQATIETAAELHELLGGFCFGPLSIHLVSIQAQLRTAIHGLKTLPDAKASFQDKPNSAWNLSSGTFSCSGFRMVALEAMA